MGDGGVTTGAWARERAVPWGARRETGAGGSSTEETAGGKIVEARLMPYRCGDRLRNDLQGAFEKGVAVLELAVMLAGGGRDDDCCGRLSDKYLKLDVRAYAVEGH